MLKKIEFEGKIYTVIDESESHYNVGADNGQGYHWIDKSKATIYVPPITETMDAAMTAFNKWHKFLADNPERDIDKDIVTITFNSRFFDIPMYSTDFLEITAKYLQELYETAEENEW